MTTGIYHQESIFTEHFCYISGQGKKLHTPIHMLTSHEEDLVSFVME
jgi:hypothetical protein